MQRVETSSRFAERAKRAVAGIVLGATIGIVFSFPPFHVFFGLPGSIVALGTGDLESGETDLNWIWVAAPVNAFLYGVIGGFAGFRLVRAADPGHCAKCDYDLTGNTSGVCPECGTRA